MIEISIHSTLNSIIVKSNIVIVIVPKSKINIYIIDSLILAGR